MTVGAWILAFGLWMLLTNDFSWGNAIIGAVGALCVCWLPKHRFSVWQLIRLLWVVAIHVPQALWQSLMILLFPHRYERYKSETLKNPEDPWGTFCQIFVITFTPKSLVVSDEEDGQVQVHSVERKESV